MNANQRLKLQEMITENNVADNTPLIRMFKHSEKIRADVTTMATLKRDYGRLDRASFESLCASRCAFLFERYPELYNKILRQEIDMSILDKVLTSLKKVEDSEMDQHEASFEVGTLLRKMYVDSAMRSQRSRESRDARPSSKERHDKGKRRGQRKGADDDPASLARPCTTWREFKRTHLT